MSENAGFILRRPGDTFGEGRQLVPTKSFVTSRLVSFGSRSSSLSPSPDAVTAGLWCRVAGHFQNLDWLAVLSPKGWRVSLCSMLDDVNDGFGTLRVLTALCCLLGEMEAKVSDPPAKDLKFAC